MNDRMSDMDALVELAARAMCTDAAHIHRGRAATVHCGWHTEQARAALLAAGLPALLERVEAAEVGRAAASAEVHRLNPLLDDAIRDRDALAAKVAARAKAAEDEIARLRSWKAEAMQVMSGLQEVGNALGVPLGQQITARATVDTALDLRNHRDALAVKVERQRIQIAHFTEGTEG